VVRAAGKRPPFFQALPSFRHPRLLTHFATPFGESDFKVCLDPISVWQDCKFHNHDELHRQITWAAPNCHQRHSRLVLSLRHGPKSFRIQRIRFYLCLDSVTGLTRYHLAATLLCGVEGDSATQGRMHVLSPEIRKSATILYKRYGIIAIPG